MAATDNRVNIVITADELAATRALKNVQNSSKETSAAVELLSATLGRLAGTAALMAVAREAVTASLAMERINAAMKAVAGNSTLAGKEIQFIREESDRLGLVFDTTAQAFTKFSASTKNTSLEGEATRKVFVGVSEAVTALKLTGDEASGIFLALSQMMSKGKVQAEELSGQLGERLPGAVKLTADAMGMSTQELLKQMQAGQIMAADLLPKLAEQLHKTYGQAAVDSAAGGQAAINRFKNEIFNTANSISQFLMPALQVMMHGANGWMGDIRRLLGDTSTTSATLTTAEKMQQDAAAASAKQKELADKAKAEQEKIADEQRKLAEANSKRALENVRSTGRLKLDAMQFEYGRGLVLAEDYYRQMETLERETARREVEIVRARMRQVEQEKAKETDPEKRIRLQTEVTNAAAQIDKIENDLQSKVQNLWQSLAKDQQKQVEQLRDMAAETANLVYEEQQVAGLAAEYVTRLKEEAALKTSLDKLGRELANAEYAGNTVLVAALRQRISAELALRDAKKEVYAETLRLAAFESGQSALLAEAQLLELQGQTQLAELIKAEVAAKAALAEQNKKIYDIQREIRATEAANAQNVLNQDEEALRLSGEKLKNLAIELDYRKQIALLMTDSVAGATLASEVGRAGVLPAAAVAAPSSPSSFDLSSFSPGNIKGLAVGTPFVQSDGLAYLHRGEAVVTAADNRGGVTVQGGISINVTGGSTSDETVTAIAKKLIPKLNELSARQRAA